MQQRAVARIFLAIYSYLLLCCGRLVFLSVARILLVSYSYLLLACWDMVVFLMYSCSYSFLISLGKIRKKNASGIRAELREIPFRLEEIRERNASPQPQPHSPYPSPRPTARPPTAVCAVHILAGLHPKTCEDLLLSCSCPD